jgi:ribosomal protein L29
MSAAKKWRDLSVVELEETYVTFSKDLFHIKNEVKYMQKIEQLHKLKSIKRDRARVLTVLREKTQMKELS